ncbi:geranylgeranylglyceryl phosphate synthase [Pyrolobus fumarii 1A]|uniref:Geranylgeranylglyceryl phosphate synthase n=1 Tax=Pyrolobus fumarii (strain DSM 11204 / 1A) TaxID=694429 RepID=G0EEI5_PYRF1|nr:geranylgeranylglyceryl phosphate synthase [Pyrolobus fumarii 1A]
MKKLLLERKEKGCKSFFALLDPDKPIDINKLIPILTRATVVLIGGSLGVTPYDIDDLITRAREAGIDKPFVLFPGGLNNIAANADAILYMSLLNSLDPYWIIGAQVAAAPIVKRLGLEVLPTAYIIVGEGGAAGHVGRAQTIPLDKPELVAAYTLAAKYLGMQFVYLEAGSGAHTHIPPETVKLTRKVVGNDVYLIVGGGIRDVDTALAVLEAGADAIVIGTLLERQPEKATEIVETVNSYCSRDASTLHPDISS